DAASTMRSQGARALLQAGARVAAQHDLAFTPPDGDIDLLAEHVEAGGVQQQPLVRQGERLVSVLFADVRQFTAMAQQQAPAELADRVATFQRLALLAVERHHGILDKFAGDAVMATFNAAGWHVDHAEHALEVALTLV